MPEGPAPLGPGLGSLSNRAHSRFPGDSRIWDTTARDTSQSPSRCLPAGSRSEGSSHHVPYHGLGPSETESPSHTCSAPPQHPSQARAAPSPAHVKEASSSVSATARHGCVGQHPGHPLVALSRDPGACQSTGPTTGTLALSRNSQVSSSPLWLSGDRCQRKSACAHGLAPHLPIEPLPQLFAEHFPLCFLNPTCTFPTCLSLNVTRSTIFRSFSKASRSLAFGL